jgi:hypothetical protein
MGWDRNDIVGTLRDIALNYHQHRPFYTAAADEIEHLRASNAELLEALETYLKVRQDVQWDDLDMDNADDKARAAIAKAKSEA